MSVLLTIILTFSDCSMGDDWKILVVDLFTTEGLQVCRVSERWIKDEKTIYVPNLRGPRFDKAVKNHEMPDNKYSEYEYVKRKVCGKNFVSHFLSVPYLSALI
jgi:hypothetical protein